MSRFTGTHLAPALVIVAGLFCASPSDARVDGYPYLDNETLGMFEVIRGAIAGPESEFAAEYWGLESLEESLGNMIGLARYLLAGASFATSAVAAHFPAYRQPYSEVLGKLVTKMLQQRAWQSWLKLYGNDPLAKDNLMYRGYLFHMMALYQAQSGDDRFHREQVLRHADGRTFRTDAVRLARSLAEETAAVVNAQGQHYFGVACEPGQVFVICNTQHHMGFLLHDRINGTNDGQVTAQWLAWTKSSMVDPQSGLFYSMYRPAKPPAEQIDAGLSGLFNAMSIIFIDALDPDWGKSLYPRFVARHVLSDAASPNGPGTAVARDGMFDQGKLYEFAVTVTTTGAAMVLARAHGDEVLYKKLLASWNIYLGVPSWDVAKRRFSYDFPPLVPLVLQNGFPLWAKATSSTFNTETNARRASIAFDTPHLQQVDNQKAFINQAYYDEAKAMLLITVNGGDATREPARLTIAGLDPQKRYLVQRDGVAYKAWERQGAQLVVTTPPLSSGEESYQVVVDTFSAGCGCRSATGPIEPLSLVGMILGLGLARRRSVRGLRRRRRRED